MSKRDDGTTSSSELSSDQANSKLPTLHYDYRGGCRVKCQNTSERSTTAHQGSHKNEALPSIQADESAVSPPTFRRGRRNASIGGIGLVPNALNTQFQHPKRQPSPEYSPPKHLTAS
eukprot:759337_1